MDTLWRRNERDWRSCVMACWRLPTESIGAKGHQMSQLQLGQNGETWTTECISMDLFLLMSHVNSLGHKFLFLTPRWDTNDIHKTNDNWMPNYIPKCDTFGSLWCRRYVLTSYQNWSDWNWKTQLACLSSNNTRFIVYKSLQRTIAQCNKKKWNEWKCASTQKPPS